jgi:phosphoribosylformylglycinamidine (FGAM) synthase-like enzyme
VGVPTVGGEVNFHPAYNGNILVNAMTVGVADTDKIFYSAASGVGNPIVYVGSKTGRDGIHGATMASAEFDEKARRKAPDRAGRRPLHREAADRGLPRTDGDRRDRRDPGHGRGRPHLLLGRDGVQGRRGIELDMDKVPQRETA